jgi:uncharacterized protein (DUF1697 family)
MNNYVALFRGINVGGKHIVPMQDLRDILSVLGCENIETYIQSGNVVLSSAAGAEDLSASITAAINERFDFEPYVLVLSADRFCQIAAANPYAEDGLEPKFLHVSFLTTNPVDSDLEALDKLKADSERFTLDDGAFYLCAPDGIGRSRLASRVEQHLGVTATSRNWRTVCKLVDILQR